MKLKTAIYITDLSYGFFIILGFLGIVACILTLRGGVLVIGILAVVTLFVIAFQVKRGFINFYLKKCKYPFEFLSVLEQLGLTKDLQIDRSENYINGLNKSQLKTHEFLLDNHLTTNIAGRRRSIFSWLNSRESENEHQPAVCFLEKGLLLDNTKYDWDSIIDWGFISSDTHAGEMEITYQEGATVKKVHLDLERINSSHIDLMLLLTHFKAKFG